MRSFIVTASDDSIVPLSVELVEGSALRATQPLGIDLAFHQVWLEPESNRTMWGCLEGMFWIELTTQEASGTLSTYISIFSFMAIE